MFHAERPFSKRKSDRDRRKSHKNLGEMMSQQTFFHSLVRIILPNVLFAVGQEKRAKDWKRTASGTDGRATDLRRKRLRFD
jgi:hypothetical protein